MGNSAFCGTRQWSRSIAVATACFISLSLDVARLAADQSAGQLDGQSRPPNIVLIMADDVSWECFGSYGGQDYRTPHIDRLAANGMQFSHCYSTPICTTSRVQLMTGQYNFRNYTHFGYLDPEQKTFGNLLHAAGYQTAIAGKWQLNGLTNQLPGYEDRLRPRHAGFDQWMLWQLTLPKSSGERFWSPVFEHNGNVLSAVDNAGKYGPDLLCNFVCEFMTQQQEQPFFVYYPMVLVHDPFVPTPDTIGDGSRGPEANNARGQTLADDKRNFVAMVETMDKIVGRIVQHLEELGQLEQTLILFTADNGTNTRITSRWQGRNIVGGKASMTDMGTHVPLIAHWPSRISAGQVSEELVDFTDFYPTLADVAGLTLGRDDPSDGFSFYPQLLGQAGERRKWVFCHYQPYWNKTPGQFLRDDRFKLYRDGRFFDIGSGDLEERQDISAGLGSVVAEQSRQTLGKVLEAAPPAPVGKGTKDTQQRPVYPTWPAIQ